jgi:predicted RNA-binding Zn-ribbon protein involved in translation (DUF1610 family)
MSEMDELTDAIVSLQKRLNAIETMVGEALKKDNGKQEMSAAAHAALHRTRFDIADRGSTVDITCPDCGGTQFGISKPVLEVTKEIVKEKEVIPKGYMKIPDDVGGVLPLLDTRHEDGKSIFDCPNCARQVSGWLDKNMANLQKLGYVKRK